jgi:hypothetical protein
MASRVSPLAVAIKADLRMRSKGILLLMFEIRMY